MNRPSRPSGFTLVELMIVVAIIGLLASMAIPGMQNFVLRSKRAERTGVMRGIENELQAAVGRNNGVCPTGVGGPGTTFGFYNPDPTTPITGMKKPWISSRTTDDWKILEFKPDGYLYYHYYFVCSGGGTTPVELTVGALGNLDNDTVNSDCVHTWKIQPSGDIWYMTNEATYRDACDKSW